MNSITASYTSRVRDIFPTENSLPTTDITINGCLFHPYIFKSGWKENKKLFGTCDCGTTNAPRTRHSFFVCLRCQRAEYIYAESHKSKIRGRTATQIEAERTKRQKRAEAEKYMERIYSVRGLHFT